MSNEWLIESINALNKRRNELYLDWERNFERTTALQGRATDGWVRVVSTVNSLILTGWIALLSFGGIHHEIEIFECLVSAKWFISVSSCASVISLALVAYQHFIASNLQVHIESLHTQRYRLIDAQVVDGLKQIPQSVHSGEIKEAHTLFQKIFEDPEGLKKSQAPLINQINELSRYAYNAFRSCYIGFLIALVVAMVSFIILIKIK